MTPKLKDAKNVSANDNESMRIFISYGHDKYLNVAKRIAADLERHGYEIWFDEEKLKAGKHWEQDIEAGIESVVEAGDNGWLVLLMTPHSVRRPDGFCLNELAYALDCQLDVVPVMVDQVRPPVCICRLQWLNMQDCIPLSSNEARYQKRFGQLLDALGGEPIDCEGSQIALRNLLRPLCFRADVVHHLTKFTGREWLLERIEEWVTSPGAGRLFWLTGDPGVGKSAIASRLMGRHSEIGAFHVCRFGDNEKSNSQRAVMSIAYQLTTQVPGLIEYISEISDLANFLNTSNAASIFDRLIVEPLHILSPPDDKSVIVLIDGLDEAAHGDKNEFAEFLSQKIFQTPRWLRFIVTSRPEVSVTRPFERFAKYRYQLDAASDDNRTDIVSYLRAELKPFAQNDTQLETAIQTIINKSDALFLYVDQVVKELASGGLTLDDPSAFPDGLKGIYRQFFQRQFPDVRQYEETDCYVFSVIVAARGAMPARVLGRIFKWTAFDVKRKPKKWGALFKIVDDRIRPFHRTLVDWITDENSAGEYLVLPEEGDRFICESGWEEFQQGANEMSDYMTTHLPAHLANMGETEKRRHV